MWRIGATSRVQGKVNLITGRQLRDPPGYRLGIQVGSHSSGILDPDNHLGDVMSLVLRRKVRIAKNRKGKNMEAARKDASSFFKDLTSLSAGDLGPPGDAAYDSGRQPWTRLRATAPDVLEGDVMSVERPFTDEKWAEFEDMADLEKLLGRTNLSDLEDLPDLGELLDLEESGLCPTEVFKRYVSTD